MPTPTRSGYTFKGWYTSSSGGSQVTSSSYFSNGQTIYAQWEVLNTEKYYINLEAQGGTVSASTLEISASYNGTLVDGTLPTPTRDGYNFLGWFTASSGGTEVTSSSYFSNGQTIYAQWETPSVSYYINLDANGGEVIPTTLEISGFYAKLLGTLPTPTRTGYTFLGWFNAASGGTEQTNDSYYSHSQTIYAQWEEIKSSYSITLNANGGEVTPTTLEITQEYGGTLLSGIELPTPRKTGNAFLGWYTAIMGGTQITTTSLLNHGDIVYAQWEVSNICQSCGIDHSQAIAITSGGTYTSSGNYYLANHVNADLIFTGSGQDSTEVTLCLNDKTITGSGTSSVIYLSNIIFHLYGGEMGTGTITGGNTVNGAGIKAEKVIFYLNGGIISDNSGTNDGGGVYLYNSTFYMNGGKIKNNSVSFSGGGVALSYSEGYMTGGVVENNNASFSGGGIDVNGMSSFIMNGGVVAENGLTSRSLYGGGVSVINNSSFVMNGGTIRDNEGVVGAGVGVVNNCTFALNSGIITSNAANYGGGIGCDDSVLNMYGGEILSNFAPYGGGIYLKNSTSTMNGGTVSENRASYKYLLAGNGGGVYATGSTFYLESGNVINNTALFGAGIFSNCATIHMSGGSVNYNSVTYDERYGFGGSGGGFYSVGTEEYPATLSITGGEALNNSAEMLGGGVLVAYTCNTTFTGGIFSSNTAGEDGNGVFLYTENGQFFLNGALTFRDEISVYDNTYLTLGDNFSVTSSIPVSMQYNGQFTQGAKSGDISKFTAFDNGCSVSLVPNSTELQIIGVSSYSVTDSASDSLVAPEVEGNFDENQTAYEGSNQTTPSTPSSSYTGTPSSWATAWVESANSSGMLRGMTDVTSNFQSDITREQFCRLVMNVYDLAGGTRPVTPISSFTDTSNADVLAANALGIVGGVSATKFSPNTYITRQELALMVLRVAEYFTEIPTLSTELNYTDKDNVDSWAKEAVYYAQLQSFLVGSGNKILPLDNLSCEEAITVTLRLLQKFG